MILFIHFREDTIYACLNVASTENMGKKSQVQGPAHTKFIEVSFLDMLNVWKYHWRYDELVIAGSASSL